MNGQAQQQPQAQQPSQAQEQPQVQEQPGPDTKSVGLFPGQSKTFPTYVAPHPTLLTVENINAQFAATYRLTAGAETNEYTVQAGQTQQQKGYWGGIRIGVKNITAGDSPQIVAWTS